MMVLPPECEQPLSIESQVNHDNHERSPIEKNRQTTDNCFMFVFLPLLVVWLLISIAGFYNVEKAIADKNIAYIQIFLTAPVIKFSAALPVSIILCMAIIFLCLFFYEKLTEGCIYISIMMSILGTIGFCFQLLIPIYAYPSKMEDSTVKYIESIVKWSPIVAILILIYYLIYALLQLLFMITSAISFFESDIKVLCDITKDSCRLIQRCPYLLLFSSLISIFGFLLFSVTVNAFLIDIHVSGIFNIFAAITAVGGICTLGLVVNFARMVISEYAINYSYTKIEKAPIGPIITKTFRFHMGTLMFASTMLISIIGSVIQALKYKPSWRVKDSYIFYSVTKLVLVLNPDISLIFSSIYGTGFLKSYQNAFDTLLRRSKTYLAMLMVIEGVFAIIILTLIIPVAVIIVVSIIFESEAGIDEDHWINVSKIVSIVLYGFSYIFCVFALLISSTMKGLLVNKIVNLNKQECDEGEKSEMLNRF